MDKNAKSKPSPLIGQFEKECAAAKVSPITVLVSAGIHKSAWARWKSGRVSPQLRNFEAARKSLEQLARAGTA